ncbi:MAG: hypothetical protein ACTSRI_09260 [Promethearchaeota archaeon]
MKSKRNDLKNLKNKKIKLSNEPNITVKSPTNQNSNLQRTKDHEKIRHKICPPNANRCRREKQGIVFY